MDNQNNTETRPLVRRLEFYSNRKKKFLKFSHEFPEFWPLVIDLELVENRERFAAFFHDKIGTGSQVKTFLSTFMAVKVAMY